MKTLNIPLEDSEFRRVKKVRDLTNSRSWKEWIMMQCKRSEEENRVEQNEA